MNISFIIPSKNNLEYLKIAVNSIRTCCGPNHELVILDDASTDGTDEYIKELMKTDMNVKTQRTTVSVGIGVLYNLGVMLSSNDVFSIFHADMVCTPHYVENLTKHLRRGRVVCATRIEPPLHPAGGDKIIKDFGIYPNELKLKELYEFTKQESKSNFNKIESCIFAPWLMYKQDFIDVGGHDELFPITYEDSDIFNRFLLSKYDLIQAKDSFVYHFTCRGHKWTEKVGVEDKDYKRLEEIGRKNFIRKWGTFFRVTQNNYPIVPHKYNIVYVIKNCYKELLNFIEPYGDVIYIDNEELIKTYISENQPSTTFNLSDRVKHMSENKNDADVIVTFDGKFIGNNELAFIDNLSDILTENKDNITYGEEMAYSIFSIKINALRELENNFIKNVNNKILEYLLTNN
jgi:glycosyltransferase involved in cell wall biosynthesis